MELVRQLWQLITLHSSARNGFRVFLLDLDVYAPSLQTYFEMEPDRWINDFLTGDTELNDVIVDLTSIVIGNNYDNNSNSSLLLLLILLLLTASYGLVLAIRKRKKYTNSREENRRRYNFFADS